MLITSLPLSVHSLLCEIWLLLEKALTPEHDGFVTSILIFSIISFVDVLIIWEKRKKKKPLGRFKTRHHFLVEMKGTQIYIIKNC